MTVPTNTPGTGMVERVAPDESARLFGGYGSGPDSTGKRRTKINEPVRRDW